MEGAASGGEVVKETGGTESAVGVVGVVRGVGGVNIEVETVKFAVTWKAKSGVCCVWVLVLVLALCVCVCVCVLCVYVTEFCTCDVM